ncbi:MAG TPA: cupin domain-containing protein [Bryobacteraceae bacterium]|nr:cupin domain-containing protein [Bryobacteraceae bacterium]
MQKVALNVILFTLPAAIAFSQPTAPPKEAIDITDADVKEVLKHAPPAIDQQLKIVDIGKYNLAVGIVHRGPTKDREDGAIPGIAHHQQTETYIIVEGSGTLVTGGSIIGAREISKDSEAYKVLNGPSMTGTVKDGHSRVVKPGDIIIIPPDVFHGWTKITDHVNYLSVRPDPDHVLPAGYVNPALKK